MAQQSVWDEPTVKDGMKRVHQLEASMADSLKYAEELFSMAQYCQTIGMYRQSKEIAELSIQLLENKLKDTPEDEKYPIHKELVYAYTFLGNLSIGRKNVIFPGGMMEQVVAMQYTWAIVSESLNLQTKAIETEDIAILRKARKMHEDLPDNWDAESIYYWEQGNLSRTKELLTKELEKHKGTEQYKQIESRLKVLALLNDSTMDAADQCISIAEKMQHLTEIEPILKIQRLPEYFMILRTSAQIYELVRQPRKALNAYNKILKYLFLLMEKELPYLLPSERSTIWEIAQPYYNEMQRFACNNIQIPEIAEFLYNSNLLKKELFTSISPKLQATLAAAKDEYLLNIQQEINKLRFSENYFKNPSDTDYIKKLTNEIAIRNMERVLTAHLKEKYKIEYQQHNEWKEVAASLSPQEAVVEIISLPVSPEFLNREYLVIVFTTRDKMPYLVPLCSYLELPALIMDNEEGYRRLWAPIEKRLKGRTHIYLSLDGQLNTTPFAQLFDGKRFLCEKYLLHHLLNTSDIPLMKQQKEKQSERDIIFFGGAEFNLPPDELYPSVRGQGFAYLPGSITEIDSISKILSNHGWNIHKYIGKRANETSFKNLSYQSFSSPAVLHIATHGFNLTYSDSIQSTAIVYKGKSGYEDPLMRTGFLLSGANEAWTEERPLDGKEDGILTAFEISSLNLANIDLAVLSSCYSAEGDARDGEGVFGLQRAFRLAGVRSMLINLWEVSDKATVEFMTEFYKLWLQGMSKQEAFARTQRNMVHKCPNCVREWGGFILIE